MTTTTNTRIMTLADLPLVQRLTGSGTVLDSEVGLTRDARGAYSFHLSSLLFPRGLYTLVARAEVQTVVGQFRYRPDDLVAHIVTIAPTLDDTQDDTVWLHILDAMAREAGKHGAHALVAEVETLSPLFEILRQARFATYARQQIWHHAPVTRHQETTDITLREETNDDQIGILSLITNTVPTMLHQIAMPPSDMDGLVYRRDGRVEAYIGISEGKHGVYLLPYLHPDMMSDAADIISAAIAHTNRADKVPVYVCVRSYHHWLNSIMASLGFEEFVEQAVMVKHLVAGVQHPSFRKVRLHAKLETCPPGIWSNKHNNEYTHEEVS